MIFMNLCRDRASTARYHPWVTAAALYPDTPPLRTLLWPVGQGHALQVQAFGCEDGIPALVLHGGPGSGCSALLRRVFDPQRYRVICIDQRGAGQSTPCGATLHNSTPHLLADLRRLRQHLGLSGWLVVGGSWGATLALLHAADDPQAVQALLLRSSFLAREEDIHWFFQGAARLRPEAWQAFAATAPAARRGHMLGWLAQVFLQADLNSQQAAASAWWAWEQALCGTAAPSPQGGALQTLVNRYRVQSHYLLHGCWLDTPLLQRCAVLPPVPTLLLHAANDNVCRPDGARALHRQLPHAALRWIGGAGHDAAHPAMLSATVQALDGYAHSGRWESPE